MFQIFIKKPGSINKSVKTAHSHAHGISIKPVHVFIHIFYRTLSTFTVIIFKLCYAHLEMHCNIIKCRDLSIKELYEHILNIGIYNRVNFQNEPTLIQYSKKLNNVFSIPHHSHLFKTSFKLIYQKFALILEMLKFERLCT